MEFSRGFERAGFNQLVFDDTDQQLRTQLASTQFSTQLNLGHLIHQADNHRGSFRGLGFELRTDAYGSIRGGRGVLLSTYGITPVEPSGDNAAGIALAGQMKALSKTLSDAARTHETVALAGSIGSVKATQSVLSEREAPAAAMQTAFKGMVSGESLEAAVDDAAGKSTTAGEGKLPQLTDPIVAVSARAGLAVAAGQDVAFLAGENVGLASGADLSVAAGAAARIHTGQAIGMLGGAIGPGDQAAGKGIMVDDGEADAILAILQEHGSNASRLHSESHQIVWNALTWSARASLSQSTTIKWCKACMQHPSLLVGDGSANLRTWLQKTHITIPN